jgi:hypothetical protein
MWVSSASDDREQWVATAWCWTAVQRLDCRPVPGLAKVVLDQLSVAGVVESLPDRDRLRWEASVGKRHYQRGIGSEHTADFAQDVDWRGEVLNGDADRGTIELGRSELQAWFVIEVVHDMGVQPWVGSELVSIQTQADYSGVGDLWRQVAHPAAHEVQEGSPGWKELAVQLRDGRDGRVVDVRDESRLGIEEPVRALVVPAERFNG